MKNFKIGLLFFFFSNFSRSGQIKCSHLCERRLRQKRKMRRAHARLVVVEIRNSIHVPLAWWLPSTHTFIPASQWCAWFVWLVSVIFQGVLEFLEEMCSFRWEGGREAGGKQHNMDIIIYCGHLTNHPTTQWLKAMTIYLASDSGGRKFRQGSVLGWSSLCVCWLGWLSTSQGGWWLWVGVS